MKIRNVRLTIEPSYIDGEENAEVRFTIFEVRSGAQFSTAEVVPWNDLISRYDQLMAHGVAKLKAFILKKEKEEADESEDDR